MRFRSLNFSFYMLRKIVSLHVMKVAYFVFTKQYSNIFDNGIKLKLLQQQWIVRTCLQKTNFEGPTVAFQGV